MRNTAIRRPRGWPLRFYEGIVRLGGSLPDGQDSKALGPSPTVYDVDTVVGLLSSEEEWIDPIDLPRAEPPAEGGLLLADFVLPDSLEERSADVRREGAMSSAEEWIVDGVGEAARGEMVGAMFARVGAPPDGLDRTWRATVTLAGWEAAPGGGRAMRAEQTYEWLLGFTDQGRFGGVRGFEVAGRDLAGAEPQERELWEHYGMAMLYPFLFSFALLACENVDGELVSSGEFAGDPRYIRPSVRQVPQEPKGGWKIETVASMPSCGHFARMGTTKGGSPSTGDGLYWLPA